MKFGHVFATLGAVLLMNGTAWADAASSSVRAPASILATPATFRIIAFGSSSTEGIGATRPAATYPAQLQADLTTMVPKGWSVEVLNRGIGGEDADDMANRLQADVIARHPKVVIWQTGSNDPLRHVPLARFERETRDGVAAMQAAGIDVILMEPQWCPRLETVSTTDGFRDAIRRIGQDMHVDVIRRSELMHRWISQGVLTRQQMLSSDGLHMTDGGYALLARSVASEVLKAVQPAAAVQTAAAPLGASVAGRPH